LYENNPDFLNGLVAANPQINIVSLQADLESANLSALLKQVNPLVLNHFCTTTDFSTIPSERGQLPGHGARTVN
jgi:hypothetical protein